MAGLGWKGAADVAVFPAYDDARWITEERLKASGGFR
jgi:hypothetical protein